MAEGFFGELGEKAGYPFNQVNSESVKYAAGGFGLATLCGSLAVSAICIGSVVPGDDAKKLVAELFNFYKAAEFPEYQPEYQGLLKKSISDSYLCDDSVGKFMKAQGVAYDSPVRKARCAGTAADTTRKMVELINGYYKL